MDFRGFIEEIKAILNIQQNPLKNTKFANYLEFNEKHTKLLHHCTYRPRKIYFG